MSMRIRALCIFSITFIFVCVAGITALHFMLIEGVKLHEHDEVRSSVQRVANEIAKDISALQVICEDYSAWDATYEYADNPTVAYEDANLLLSTFHTLDLQLVVITNDEDEILFKKFYNRESISSNAFPDTLTAALQSAGLFDLKNKAFSNRKAGLLHWGESGVWLVAVNPILRSNDLGPVRGVFVMGRMLDAKFLESFSQHTLETLTVVKEPLLSERHYEELPLLHGLTARYAIKRTSEDMLEAEIALPDIAGEAVTRIRLTIERSYYQMARKRILAFSVFLGVLAALVMVFLWTRLEIIVISRIKTIAKELGEIADSGDYSKRVSVNGKDEIAEVAGVTNLLLSILDKKTQQK